MPEFSRFRKYWRPALFVGSLSALIVAVGAVIIAPVVHAAAVTATYATTSQWDSGFVANYKITNAGATAINGWKVEFDLPANEAITSAWNGTLAKSGTHYVLTPASWTQTIAPGSSVTVGFQGTQTGAYAPPVNCLVNGQSCSGGGATITSTPTTTTPTTTTTTPTTTTTTTTPTTTTPTTTQTTPTTTTSAGTAAAVFAETQDWGTGFNGNFKITNSGTAPLNGWKLEFDLPTSEKLTSIWNGVLATQATHYVITPASWTQTVPANGGAVNIGVQGAYTAGYTAPMNCTLNGQSCSGSGVTPPPTTATTPTTTTTTTTPAPTQSGATSPRFAPYVDMSLWPQFNYANAISAGGLKHVTLGFIVSGTAACTPTWGTYYTLNDPWVTTAMTALQSGGADAIVSFGGQANQSLATTCTSVDALVAAYQSVIDAYGIRDLDFDVEGATQADTATNTRRSLALAQLQANGAAAGKPVRVSFTLPVLPTGLTADGLGVVTNAIANGVDIGQVNLMAMDYYAQLQGTMGDAAIQAAQNVHIQLAALYPSKTSAQVWAMIGVTPMIGVNDDSSEIFTLADAATVTNFAKQQGWGRLAMWSANRDVQCPAGQSSSPKCSGVTQNPWAFSSIFEQFPG